VFLCGGGEALRRLKACKGIRREAFGLRRHLIEQHLSIFILTTGSGPNSRMIDGFHHVKRVRC
jgi:hypothetical protein